MEKTTIYKETLVAVTGDLIKIDSKKDFDIEIRAYDCLEIEIKIKRIDKPF